LLACLENEEAAPFIYCQKRFTAPKSDKVTNITHIDIHDYDFSIVGIEYFYAVANAYRKRAELIVQIMPNVRYNFSRLCCGCLNNGLILIIYFDVRFIVLTFRRNVLPPF
jgi:hypothetical protein